MRHTRLLVIALLVTIGVTALHAAEPAAQQPLRTDLEKISALATASRMTHESRALVLDAPGEVEFAIRISPTAHSKELRVSADSGDFYRSTTIGLGGADSDPLHTFVWRGFPAGDYEVVGALLDDTGAEQIVVQASLRVLDR